MIGVCVVFINLFDVKWLCGMFGGVMFFMWFGLEVSGVIMVVGLDVVGLVGLIVVGDEVVVFFVSGGFVSELMVKVDLVLLKLVGFGWGVGVGLLFVGCMVFYLVEVIGVVWGDCVMVYVVIGVVGLLVV